MSSTKWRWWFKEDHKPIWWFTDDHKLKNPALGSMVPGTFPKLARSWKLVSYANGKCSRCWFKDDQNYDVEEAESLLPSRGLRKTTNHCLTELEGVLLRGGLRKTTNQSHSLVIAQLIGL
jgi:hypothetical protein